MSVAAFLIALRRSGCVSVPPVEIAPSGGDLAAPAELDQIGPIIQEMDVAARLELAFAPPGLVLPAAKWAAETLYRACQFLVYRDVDGGIVQAVMARRCPCESGADVCYSVDLVMQHLPELWRISRGLAEADPLTASLANLAKDWPLSSVGMPGVQAPNIEAFIHDRCLRRLYADRIIGCADKTRLADKRVAEAVAEAIGLRDELSPSMATALKEQATL